ncbi:HDOD domain-containing protein [Ferrimonas sediminicola]|uniref:HDOD domain-containing protein n=1 Tax=Ferrimonas sediminicola TaxID=2569538 RepID=A0A4U1BB26_9GAMM|nr:HDOD domain-containing protein [Ferrimonas sediminicola]TKB48038.1 HDOD domain-containing protein [Ferrimonas sediminicola]
MSTQLPKPRLLDQLEQQFWQYQSLSEPIHAPSPTMEDEVAFVWRYKLAVERAAEFKRIQKNQQRSEQQQKLRQFFCRAFEAELGRLLAQPEGARKVMGIEVAQLDMLELLLDPDGDVRRLTRCIELDPWLSQALIRHINSNRFEFRRASELHDVQLAINYLGYEKLCQLIPSLVYEHWSWSPDQSQGLHQRKLWRWCRLLKSRAEYWLGEEGIGGDSARIYACLFALGPILVHRQATHLYQRMRGEWMNQARLEPEGDLSEGLRHLRLPCEPVAEHLQRHLAIARRFLEGVGYSGRFLRLLTALEQPWMQSEPAARALSRAFGEVVYLTLSGRVMKQEDGLEVITGYYQIPEARVRVLHRG